VLKRIFEKSLRADCGRISREADLRARVFRRWRDVGVD
jgi:hypothetical protein